MKGLFILGLTGPSGAGKSEVARLLAEKGIPLVDADALVREVQKPGSPCLKALAEAFSPDILRPDGVARPAKVGRTGFLLPGTDTAAQPHRPSGCHRAVGGTVPPGGGRRGKGGGFGRPAFV